MFFPFLVWLTTPSFEWCEKIIACFEGAGGGGEKQDNLHMHEVCLCVCASCLQAGEFMHEEEKKELEKKPQKCDFCRKNSGKQSVGCRLFLMH